VRTWLSCEQSVICHRARRIQMKYRPEIDGLRAVAVLLVVLFHVDGHICSGGYIGVDIFFVISGFLITSIIRQQIADGTFTLLGFYERRARRILPAFVVVVTFALAVSWYLVLPSAFKAVGRAAAASSVSLSNVLFWAEDGYFAAASEDKPLLHTWSLGVEEQFYFLLPCLFLILGVKRRSTTAMCSLVAISFVTSIWLVRTDSSAAFFLLPTRAWELLIGSLLSVIMAECSVLRRPGRIVAMMGLAAILCGAWGYDVGTAFPGENALLPCLGAAAVIYGSADGAVGKFLSVRPLVFVGRISYSLYLWHWPILVFARKLAIRPLTGFEASLCVLLSVAAAIVSWKYVEQPFRTLNPALTRRRVFSLSCVSLALLAVSGVYIHVSEGASSRFSAAVVSLDSGSFDRELRNAERESVCWSRDDGVVIYGAKVEPRFAVLGDSHSNVIALKLGALAKERGQSLRHFYEFGAAPILGVRFVSNPGADTRIEESVQSIEASESIETAILVARWAYVVHGFNTDFGAYERDRSGAPGILMLNSERRMTKDQARDLFRVGLSKIVSRLKTAGKRVVVMYPTPEVGYHVPRTMARLLHYYGTADGFSRPSDYYFRRQRVVFSVLDSLGNIVERVYPHQVFVAEGTAIVQDEGWPLYRDDDHLTLAGAEMLMPMFEEILWTTSGDGASGVDTVIQVSAESTWHEDNEPERSANAGSLDRGVQ